MYGAAGPNFLRLSFISLTSCSDNNYYPPRAPPAVSLLEVRANFTCNKFLLQQFPPTTSSTCKSIAGRLRPRPKLLCYNPNRAGGAWLGFRGLCIAKYEVRTRHRTPGFRSTKMESYQKDTIPTLYKSWGVPGGGRNLLGGHETRNLDSSKTGENDPWHLWWHI